MLRNSIHEHYFFPHKKIHETVCGDCHLLIMAAAQPLLAVAIEAQIECSVEALGRALSDGTIMLYVQQVLTEKN